ncbi:ion transporter [sulfur-oxidizing endosymbiont of Gigantopelta aegis]|uniref:ion transporter n=1 Tax=sulfur-oxidizing endosymbiont of Gigantopelta aegis TaxID=2794934 RepID=UPI0018DCB726|nr:ion transporter [sulfur-oxidizing endosymbiont of Gigantopelta aegis]
MRKTIQKLIETKQFQHFITFLIIFNGITLGLATDKDFMADYGAIIDGLDMLIVAIFTVEITLRIYVHRLAFFKDPWSLFDFFVVSISLIPANDGLSILRVLRVLRLFRLLTIVPQMRLIISAILSVIPGMASVSLVLLLFFYVFAIIATNLFSVAFPQWFGGLGESMYTLFQIMTLESWSMGIARPVMEEFPLSWIFFVIYILIVTFIMVNLFIGLVVDAIFTIKGSEAKANEEDADKPETAKELVYQHEIKVLQIELKEMKSLLTKIDNKLS